MDQAIHKLNVGHYTLDVKVSQMIDRLTRMDGKSLCLWHHFRMTDEYRVFFCFFFQLKWLSWRTTSEKSISTARTTARSLEDWKVAKNVLLLCKLKLK